MFHIEPYSKGWDCLDPVINVGDRQTFLVENTNNRESAETMSLSVKEYGFVKNIRIVLEVSTFRSLLRSRSKIDSVFSPSPPPGGGKCGGEALSESPFRPEKLKRFPYIEINPSVGLIEVAPTEYPSWGKV